MRTNRVAAQLYSVRDFLKTPADIAASLKRIRAVGYEAVQISGMGPIEEMELAGILAGEGLTCCATHENTATILSEPQKIIDRLGRLACTFTALPHHGNLIGTALESVGKFAASVNAAGRTLADAGITLTYHNHNSEFKKIAGTTVLDHIYAKTDPRALKAELDTYWVQAGGGSVTAWCTKLANRLPLLHLKDFGLNDKSEGVFKELGHGNLDWENIIPAAAKSGCTWFIVEQDGNWTNNDPFESLRISLEFLTSFPSLSKDAE